MNREWITLWLKLPHFYSSDGFLTELNVWRVYSDSVDGIKFFSNSNYQKLYQLCMKSLVWVKNLSINTMQKLESNSITESFCCYTNFHLMRTLHSNQLSIKEYNKLNVLYLSTLLFSWTYFNVTPFFFIHPLQYHTYTINYEYFPKGEEYQKVVWNRKRYELWKVFINSTKQFFPEILIFWNWKNFLFKRSLSFKFRIPLMIDFKPI